MFTYKMSLNHHFKNAWTIIIYLLIISAVPLYMVNRFGTEDFFEFVKLSVITFLLIFIPQLVLHLNYYFRNKGDIFFYDPSRQKITIEHKGQSVNFSFSEIELIKRFKSYPLAEKRLQWFPWDSYNYSVIRLKGGKEFIVTSLLVPDMDLPIESEKIMLVKTFYPIVQDYA